MPAGLSDDDINRVSEELWAKVFHPEVVAGVSAAQELLDSETLAFLDRDLREPECSAINCTYSATSVAYCAHTGNFIEVFCGPHREQMLGHRAPWTCKRCKHTGTTRQLVRWRGIFTGRSRA